MERSICDTDHRCLLEGMFSLFPFKEAHSGLIRYRGLSHCACRGQGGSKSSSGEMRQELALTWRYRWPIRGRSQRIDVSWPMRVVLKIATGHEQQSQAQARHK